MIEDEAGAKKPRENTEGTREGKGADTKERGISRRDK